MKNLATCKPSEFVAQTAKIKNAVEDWTKLIKLSEIRAMKPAYKVLPIDATAEQRAQIIKENAEMEKAQMSKNLSKLLDGMLVEHPQETLNILALCCFVDPADVDNYPMDEYLQCVMDMLTNKSVLSFFSLLAQLEQTPTLTVLNR